MEEIWRKIDGYENYSVSSEGRVRNDKTGKILKGINNGKGYKYVTLCKNGKKKNFLVHQLVAQVFLLNHENKPFVDHINCVRGDNRAENLRWCSQKDNCNNPLSKKNYSEAKSGENHPMYGHTGENNPNSRAVVGINIENPDITIEYSSMGQAQKDGFNAGNICSCCNGKLKSHKGYHWCHKEDYIKFLESLK